MIFSGSAVVDARNTSGLGRPDAPPMVAVYTGDGRGRQTQNLASSLDRGRTWAKSAGSPVLDLDSKSFRDPKVFRHGPTSRWVMATVLADERKVRLWGSDDLKRWEKLSHFGPAGSTRGVWECPELFEVPFEDQAEGASRWVLKVDVNDGAPSGGPGGQYFVGRFDGKEFQAENPKPDAAPLWIGSGKDFYASQTWNDAPGGLPVWLAWMSNWQYANDIPTSPWRGAMTVPRTMLLRKSSEGLRLVQSPVAGLRTLRGKHRKLDGRLVSPGETSLADEGVEGHALEVVAEFEPGDSGSFGLKVRRGAGDETLIGFDRRAGEVFVDRSHSGAADFSPHFAGRHAAKLTIMGGARPVRLHVLVDATSVEVFAEGGRVVLTDQLFPAPESRGVGLFATGGAAWSRSLDAWELRP